MLKHDAASARDRGTTIGDLPREVQTRIAACLADLSGAWSAGAVCRELAPLLQSCKMMREATRHVAGDVEVLCTPGNAQDHAEKEVRVVS